MSENQEQNQEQNTVQSVVSTSILNLATEAVAALINALGLYAPILRGALGTGDMLSYEIGPTMPETVWLDKNRYIPIDFTINGKHSDLQVLSDAMNNIHEILTMLFYYPHGDNWQIVDITTLSAPQVIGREQDNRWIMASALAVKVATFTPEPEPETEPDPETEAGTEE